MIDMSDIHTAWATFASALTGIGGVAYKKYIDLTNAIADKPTKEDVTNIVTLECTKLNVSLDYVGKRIDELHDDINHLQEYLYNAKIPDRAARGSFSNSP